MFGLDWEGYCQKLTRLIKYIGCSVEDLLIKIEENKDELKK